MHHGYTFNPVGTFAYNPLGGSLKYVTLSLNDAPEWDIRSDYPLGQAVHRGNTYWIAIAESLGIDPVSPSGGTVWSPLIPAKVGPSQGPQGPQGSTGGAYNNQIVNLGGCGCGEPCDPGMPNNRRLTIESFSVLPTKVLIGQANPVALQFSWTLNGTPFNQILSPGEIKIPNVDRHVDIAATITQSSDYTLEVWGRGREDYSKATARVSYVNSVYYGCVPSSTPTADQITALSHVDQDDREITCTLSASNQYICLAYPERYGVANVYTNGFFNTAWDTSTMAISNSSGFSESYYVLISSYVQNGSSINLEIK